jgi:uncharacterized membrane protein
MGLGQRAWLVIVLILLLPCPVFAIDEARISSIRGIIDIQPDLYSEEELEITYTGVSGTILGDEFYLPGEISGLNVRDNEGSLDFSKRMDDGITTVRFIFRRGLRPGREYKITIAYRSANFTSKSGSLWGYSTLLLAGSEVDEWVITLSIPDDVELYLPTGPALEGLRLVAHREDRTICEWFKTDSDQLAVAMGYSPIEAKSESRLVIYLVLAGVFSVAGVAGFLIRGLLPQKRTARGVELAIRLLEDRERRIVRELAGGQNMTQAELVKATKLSKATVSRAVVELERRKVITRDRSGRVVRAKLQDWMLDS